MAGAAESDRAVGDDGEEIVWTRAYGDDYWSDATTPLFFDLLGGFLTEYVNEEGNRILGYKELYGAELVRLHKAHVYFSTRVLKEVFKYNPKFARVDQLLKYFPPEEREKMKELPFNWPKRLLAELRVAILDPDGLIWRTDKKYDEFFQGYLQVLGEIDERLERDPSVDELDELYEKLYNASLKHYRLVRWGLPIHGFGMNLILRRLLLNWCGDEDGSLYMKLVSGLPSDKTTETNLALYRLARAAKSMPEVRRILEECEAKEALSRLDETEEGREFKRLLDEFLQEYGHRCHTREIYFPRWAEAPWTVLEMVRSLMETDRDLEEVEREKRDERIKATEEALRRISRQRFGFIKKLVFKRVLGWAQQYIVFREKQRFSLDHQLFRFRKIYLAYGRHFVKMGLLRQVDDIFFLHQSEIQDLREGRLSPEEAARRIEERRKEFFEYMHVIPPKFLRGDEEFDEEVEEARGEQEELVTILRGMGVSPGEVEGRVRVILDIKDLPKVREGEILVARGTDPGWTPVFAKIAGLVTEIGGMLSHGAVVSREFGIPAVSYVKDATKLLRTGWTVHLDGTRGVVKVLRR